MTKAHEYMSDIITDKLSNCCEAPLTENGFCTDCKEHSEPKTARAIAFNKLLKALQKLPTEQYIDIARPLRDYISTI